MLSKYVSYVENALVREESFLLNLSAGGSEEITFLPKGVKCKLDISSWSLNYDQKRSQLNLRLYRGKEIISNLYLLEYGVWEGRSRINMGFDILRPQKERVSYWKSFATVLRFGKGHAAAEEEVAILDPPPPEIKVEAFDISENVNEEFEGDTAIGIAGCARLGYFKQVVHSLARNKLTHELPVFVFLDYPGDASVQEQQSVYVKEVLPSAHVIRRNVNFGCGRNLIDLRRQLFDVLGFDKVFVFEDDLIVTPNYLEFVLNLHRWATDNYDNVAVVQGWNFCKYSGWKREAYLSSVNGTFETLWGYLMSKKAWDSIKKDVYTFEELFLQCEYKKRPHRSIKHWFTMKLRQSYPPPGNRLFTLDSPQIKAWNKYLDDIPTGQDALTIVIVICA